MSVLLAGGDPATHDGLRGRAHSLRGNQALLLNRPEAVWVVLQGTLQVLSTRFRDDSPTGLRRQLFAAPQRRALFGCVPAAEAGGLGLMAVASGTTTVVEVPLAELAASLAAEPGRQGLIEEWLAALAAVLTQGQNMPSALTRASEEGEVELGQKDVLSAAAGGLLWVRVQSGDLRVVGRPDLPLRPEDGCILIGPQLWLEVASAAARVEVIMPSSARSGPLLAEGLATLHRYLNVFLNRLGEEETEVEVRRRTASKALHELQSAEAMEDLASVLERGERFPQRETPLLTALGVVGAALGVEIRPPPDSEDLSRVNVPVEAIARASRVRWRMVLLRDGWWKTDGGPLLGYLGDEERRPVALLRSGDGYVLVDPDRRRREPLTPALRDRLCPDAYMLYRPLPAGVTGVLDLLRFTARGRVADALFVLIMGVAATLLGMVVPRATGTLIDSAIPSADRGLLFELALLLVGAGLAGAVCTYMQVMTTSRASLASEVVSQSGLWDRLLALRPDFLRRYSSGELQSRVNAVSEISRELSGAALRPLITGILALLNFLLLWYYSWELARVALGVGLAVLVMTFVVSHFLRPMSYRLNDLEGALNGLVIQLIGGVAKLRVAGGEDRAFNHWVVKYTAVVRLQQRVKLLKDVIQVFHHALPVIASVILFWQAVKLTVGLPPGAPGRVSMGDFIAFNAAFILYLAGWSDVSNTLVGALDSALKGRRIRPLLEAQPEVEEDASDPGRLRGQIRFESVSFRYAKDGPFILNDVSFEAEPGEFIAFVGPSGSGKSTVLRLLLGFERPDSGRVLYDGQDLAGLNVLAVRRQIGTVLQNGRLNAGSILENISNNARVTNAEAWEAVADAGMSDDIEQMPMALHTVVAEGGANMSGGQRQRLLIARALVTRPKIVFFDEATSALDNKTQATVSQALERRKVTRVIIAHRLSTVCHADRIYVMDRGVIVQQGTFAELSRQEGMFKNLMARQMA